MSDVPPTTTAVWGIPMASFIGTPFPVAGTAFGSGRRRSHPGDEPGPTRASPRDPPALARPATGAARGYMASSSSGRSRASLAR